MCVARREARSSITFFMRSRDNVHSSGNTMFIREADVSHVHFHFDESGCLLHLRIAHESALVLSTPLFLLPCLIPSPSLSPLESVIQVN